MMPRWIATGLCALAITYAALAGLRTAWDFDLGWQLALGRQLAQQHQVPRVDTLSYTVRGTEFIYPPFAGLIFYTAHGTGGYGALSWLCAAACAATIVMLLWAGRWSALAALLAIVAVPTIAFRTAPRADLFTTLLFATLLALLWRRQYPWLVPVVMLFWVNLHPGYIAGVALIVFWLAAGWLRLLPQPDPEAGDGQARTNRRPWLLLLVALAVTLVNPWGPRIYLTIVRQIQILRPLDEFIGEWTRMRLNLASFQDALAWRNPDSSYWWLLAIAVIGAVVSLARRQYAAALLLAGAAIVSTRYIRFQAVFAAIAVVVAAAVLNGIVQKFGPRVIRAAGVVVLAAATLFASIRVGDLVSNRQYLSSGDIATFGPGLSWWFPERATAFLLRERLPRNVLHDFNAGGYLTWRIAPEYPVFLDGRCVPFGYPVFFQHRQMLQEAPDSPQLQEQADRYGINTLLFSVARYAGLGSIPLYDYCHSKNWRPIYLDETAVILLRNRPENAAWLDKLQIDCATVAFTPPQTNDRALLYNFHANAASVLYVLQRDQESFEHFARAERLFDGDPNLYLGRAQLFQAGGRLAEAEQEYRRSLSIRETDSAWYALGRLLSSQRRYAEAADAIRRSARRSLHAHERYRSLAQVYMALNDPDQALRAFDNAERSSPYYAAAAESGREFRADVAVGRARAWRRKGDLQRAGTLLQDAVALTPRNSDRWLELAEVYQAQGQTERAEQARVKAREVYGR